MPISVSAQPREHGDAIEPGSKGRAEAMEAGLVWAGQSPVLRTFSRLLLLFGRSSKAQACRQQGCAVLDKKGWQDSEPADKSHRLREMRSLTRKGSRLFARPWHLPKLEEEGSQATPALRERQTELHGMHSAQHKPTEALLWLLKKAASQPV